VSLPQFFIIGAPKAGTTALHAAIATHPNIYMSKVKEPKFFLYDGTLPVPTKGPGDAHGTKESIWRREQYEELFADAPPGMIRGESTAFYLHDPVALKRIRQEIPDAKLIAVIRDPVDRAYSNWLHLWADGLEPIGDFVDAFEAEDERIAAGWGFFWHYRQLGLYGEQLAQLLAIFPSEQLHLLRYRDLVDRPDETLNSICDFLGVDRNLTSAVPAENVRGFVPTGWRSRTMSPLVRAGARFGAYLPPEVWRTVSVPLLWALQYGGGRRPDLTVEDRRRLVAHFATDIALLEKVTGRSYADWLGDSGRGEFSARRSNQGTSVSSS
jgi:Sulfotransferase family